MAGRRYTRLDCPTARLPKAQCDMDRACIHGSTLGLWCRQDSARAATLKPARYHRGSVRQGKRTSCQCRVGFSSIERWSNPQPNCVWRGTTGLHLAAHTPSTQHRVLSSRGLRVWAGRVHRAPRWHGDRARRVRPSGNALLRDEWTAWGREATRRPHRYAAP